MIKLKAFRTSFLFLCLMEIFAGCQSNNFASGGKAQAATAQSKALETPSTIVKGSEINAILKNFMKTSKPYVFKPSS
ncbi:MAG: hypothetical protein II579_03225, partial [Treponema sp.]|nr:hypothetical protein [Treponema sp.]